MSQQPHSIEAEMSVIGAILLDNDSFHKINLSSADFYVAKHAFLFSALSKLITSGVGADLVTVSEALRGSGHLDKCGGATYLAELVDYTPTAANITYYADLVAKSSKNRQVIKAAREILEDAGQSTNPDLLISSALGKFQSIGQEAGAIWISLEEQAKLYEDFTKTAGETRVATGYPNLDGIIHGGLAPAEVMMILGYSGTFKSAFLHNILLNFCMKTGKKALFFSLEMSPVQVFQRTVQIALEQNTYYIESGYAGKKENIQYREKTMQELKQLGADNLIVCPYPAVTVEQVEHYTRVAAAQFGEIGVIGIDYLGLMSADGAKTEYERITYCSDNSKHMAKRLNLPVILLTQINRSSAANGELEKWSGKGSGGIEAAADIMLGIQRNDQKEIIVKLLKQRNGEDGLKFKADVETKYLKFRSLEPYDAIAAKNVERGRGRLRAAKQSGAVEYDPF